MGLLWEGWAWGQHVFPRHAPPEGLADGAGPLWGTDGTGNRRLTGENPGWRALVSCPAPGEPAPSPGGRRAVALRCRPSRLPPHADSAVPLRPPRPAQEPDGPTSPRRQLTGNSRKSRWTRAPPAPRPCARTEVTGASTDGGTTSAPHAPRTSARPQRHATRQGRDRLACAPLLSERRGFSPEPDAAPPAPRTKRPPTGVLRAALAGANSRGRLRRGPRYISDVSHGSGEFLPARTRK